MKHRGDKEEEMEHKHREEKLAYMENLKGFIYIYIFHIKKTKI